jgi:hypothetical protein
MAGQSQSVRAYMKNKLNARNELWVLSSQLSLYLNKMFCKFSTLSEVHDSLSAVQVCLCVYTCACVVLCVHMCMYVCLCACVCTCMCYCHYKTLLITVIVIYLCLE